MEYYLSAKKKWKWMDIEKIMMNDVTQTQKNKYTKK